MLDAPLTLVRPRCISQFGAEVYRKRAGDLSAVYVPYRGGAPMMEALAKSEAKGWWGRARLDRAAGQLGAVRPLALPPPAHAARRQRAAA